MRRAAKVGMGLTGLALLLMGASRAMGGWAVFTVHELPTQLTVGVPATITFSIRQHGVELQSGFEPEVLIRAVDAGVFDRGQTVKATWGRARGVYRATFTPRDTGEVVISLDAGYRPRYELLPVMVMATGGRPRAVTTEAHGRALFVAKGCVTCHIKNDDPLLGERQTIAIGPNLTARGLPVEWLVQKITDPEALRPATATSAYKMPRLEVTVAEATAIANYLNARTVAAR